MHSAPFFRSGSEPTSVVLALPPISKPKQPSEETQRPCELRVSSLHAPASIPQTQPHPTSGSQTAQELRAELRITTRSIGATSELLPCVRQSHHIMSHGLAATIRGATGTCTSMNSNMTYLYYSTLALDDFGPHKLHAHIVGNV